MHKFWQEIRKEAFLSHPVLTALFISSFLLLAVYSRLPFFLGFVVAALLSATCLSFGICLAKGECFEKKGEGQEGRSSGVQFGGDRGRSISTSSSTGEGSS